MIINTATCTKSQLCKHIFNLKPPKRDGLLLKICHTTIYANKTQTIRFHRATFNSSGHILSIVSHSGDIIIFNFETSKFWLLKTISTYTVHKFVPTDANDLMVGDDSGNIHIINIETGTMSSNLKGHTASIQDFSFDYNKCVSFTKTEAIIWDLELQKKIHFLEIESGSVLKKVLFVPMTKNILAYYSNDVIQVWSESFVPIKQILPSSTKRNWKSIAFTENGKIMVIAGNSHKLSVVPTDLWKAKEVCIPNNVQSIKNLEFLSHPLDGGANKILTILTGNGLILFFNMETEVILGKLTASNEIIKSSLQSRGNKIACTLTSGEIEIYDITKYFKNSTKTLQKEGPIMKRNFKRSFTKDIKNNEIYNLEIKTLTKILKEYGEFPHTYRKIIWCNILHLPNNKDQYDSIIGKGYESSFDTLENDYPIENVQDLRNLKRLLKNIVSWCPFFSEVKYLPTFAYPFIRLFQNEPIMCFEAVIFIIVNFCQYWFEYHPLPPINILDIIENVLSEHDRILLDHLNYYNVNAKIYAWALLQSAFSEVLSSNEWLILWDHIIINEPAFLLLCVVAYNVVNRGALLNFTLLSQFEFFYTNQNPIEFKRFISTAYKLLRITGEKNHPRQYLDFFKIPFDGMYPKFNCVPLGYLQNCSTKQNESSNDIFSEIARHEVKTLQESEDFEYRNHNGKIKAFRSGINSKIDNIICHEHKSQASVKLDNGNNLISNEIGEDGTNKESLSQSYIWQEMNIIKDNMTSHCDTILNDQIEGPSYDIEKKNDNESRYRKKLSNVEYVKQINVYFAIKLIDKLVKKIETETDLIQKQKLNDNLEPSKEKIQKLINEVQDMEQDLNNLISLIQSLK